jgi:hypothetical protein
MASFDFATPESRVAARKKALGDFMNVAQPAQKEADTAEQTALKKNVMAQTSALGNQAPQLAGLGSLGILQSAQGQGANMLNSQAANQDALNLQGSNMQQEIAGAKTQQALTNTAAGFESTQQRLARSIADKAFSEGMSSKQLIFHANSALADYSLEQMNKDFQAGRVSQQELTALNNQLKESAVKKKYAADEMLAKALGEFQLALGTSNTQRAKARVLAAIDAQKEAMKEAARAEGTSSIIGGVFGEVGTVLGKIFS